VRAIGRWTVRERIELNQDLTPAGISGRVMHELHSHALDAVPEECCGLVTGSPGNRFKRVYRITNVMTKKHIADSIAFPRDARHAFYMAEGEYLLAQRDAEAKGETVTAVYHSHVEAGPYLSREDLVYAEHPLFPFPGAAQIVLSVIGDQVAGSALFEADPDTGEFRHEGARLLEVDDG
jgi:proteasome lid subunit RPN8/RPN11